MLVSRTSTRSRRGLVRYAVAAAVVGMTLAGCGGETAPAPPPMESPSASSASPAAPSESAAAAPTMPPAAKGTSTAAAKAFVRHYVSPINHAVATGETRALRAASSRDCKSCRNVIARVEDVYSAGGHIESRGWKVIAIRAVPGQPAKAPMFDVGLRLSKQSVVEKTGQQPKPFDGGRLPATFSLRLVGDTWSVLEWERAA
jgi:hypothetical protein